MGTGIAETVGGQARADAVERIDEDVPGFLVVDLVIPKSPSENNRIDVGVSRRIPRTVMLG
jgi:hypothetical protein